MFFFIIILYKSTNDTSINIEKAAFSLFQYIVNLFNFLCNLFQIIFHNIITIIKHFFVIITPPISKRSLFSRYLHISINSSNTHANFTIFPKFYHVCEKIYFNKTFLHGKNNSYTSSSNMNPNDIHYEKLEFTNPFSLLFIHFSYELLNFLDLLSNLPFNNFKSLARYIRHLPPGTLKLTKFMINIHIFSTILWLIFRKDVLPVLFAQSTELTFFDLQLWRMTTSVFLHADIIHLFSNMFEFILCGPYFEKYVGTSFFIFHIFIISILVSIVEAIIHCIMFVMGFTKRIQTLSIGFSGVIFALYILAGDVARKKKKMRKLNHSHHKHKYVYVSDSSSSTSRSPSPLTRRLGHSSGSSYSPSHLKISGTNITYEDYFSNKFTPWLVLIVTFLLSPASSFTAHFAGIIVGLIYIHFLEPYKLIPRDEKFVKRFNTCFPICVIIYMCLYMSNF